jgi:queuine tRNA-ribosyltransferase
VVALSFALLGTDGAARRGRFATPHGTVETPVFMPCGTRGLVKAVTAAQVEETGTQILLANTYHLLQRPGEPTVAALGGLHTFMGWSRPILTDSGGFQVFSLSERRRLDEDGVSFTSEIDGNVIRLTPERCVAIQEALGADVIMPLDHCIEWPAAKEDVARSVATTLAWARRCAAARTRSDQALFGIVQGGVHEDLRRECAQALVGLDLPGYALGGFSVGEPKDLAAAVLAATAAVLPEAKPRYLMGVGTPHDFLDAVAAGIDMMDCVLPTRNARHAVALTRSGSLRLRNARHAADRSPLDAHCGCFTCRRHSRGYLRHLFQSDESLGGTLLTIHNLTYMADLARAARTAIAERRFAAFRDETLQELANASQDRGDAAAALL